MIDNICMIALDLCGKAVKYNGYRLNVNDCECYSSDCVN